ncbi:MAG: hypothetical protein QOE62_3216 [Actinomycetota bacterium]|nr:hypothetical protein [Actinomycetota bacterium]
MTLAALLYDGFLSFSGRGATVRGDSVTLEDEATNRMRSKRALMMAIVGMIAVLAAACGSASKTGSSVTTTTARLEVAGPNPSVSAKMICGEAKQEIAQSAIGVDTARPLAPKWVDHLYSCDYVYKGGVKMTLSVKEMSSVAETTAYYDALGTRLGRGAKLQGLGEGAYQTTQGSVVVRKDYRVLLVDVSHLPAKFGQPPAAPIDVAISVATTVMGCWTGA